MHMIRKFLLAVTLAVSTASTAFAQTPPPLEKPKITLAVGGKSAMIYLPLTIADRLGYFKAEGLTVEIDDFAGGSKAVQAVVGGSADVAVGVYEHTIRMQAIGQHLRAIVVMANSMQLALAVSSQAAGRVGSLKDLKGMTIGVSAAGSTTHMMVDRVLGAAGLKPSDYSILGVGLSNTAVAALATGRIDAICTAEATASLLEQQGLIKVLVDARTREGTEKVFGAIPTSVIYAQADWIRDNPRTAQALANAIIRAGRFIQTARTDDVLAALPESYFANDRPSYLRAFEKVRDGFSADGLFPARGGDNTVAALAAFDPKVKAADIDVPDTFTNQFATAFARQPR